jgi:predicted acyltransferase
MFIRELNAPVIGISMDETFVKPARLESLDALRGFDMLWIIGGETIIQTLAKASDSSFLNVLSKQMTHVRWDGFHFFDLIMPLFLFMVGMSIPFSIDKRLSMGEPKRKIYQHTFKRCIILLILGMAYEGNLLALDPNKLFFGSVLGWIGIGYFLSVIIYNQLNLKSQILFTVVLLITYWAILTFVPVPGQPAGVLLPESNITKYVENLVLGPFAKAGVSYMWGLDVLGCICTVMTGVFTCTIIRSNFRFSFIKSPDRQIHKTAIMVLIGLALVCIYIVLNIWFPIIKRIWTPPFVLLTSGLSFLLMALFYFIIDVKGYKRWAFWLKVIGMNSIAVYLAVHFISFDRVADTFVFGFEQFLGVYYPVLESLTALVIIYLILYWMYKKGIFLKV